MDLKYLTWLYGIMAVVSFLRAVTAGGRFRSEPSLPVPEPLPPGFEHPPLVSVIIPARNEERNLPTLLDSLSRQTYANVEIIILNDNSTDGTAHVLAEWQQRLSSLKVFDGKPLPEGWFGKPHAVYQAVSHASGEWLLLLDADTRPQPDLIRQMLGEALREKAGALTVSPHMVCTTFWEKVVQPAIVQMLIDLVPLEKVNDPAKPDILVNGQCILVRRYAYEAAGGHEAVKTEIIEDHKLATNLKASGTRYRFVHGMDLISVQMYTSFKEIWEGWSKNFYAGVGNKLPVAVVFSSIMFFLAVLPAILVLAIPLASGLFGSLSLPWWRLWLAATAQTAALILHRILGNLRQSQNPWYGLTHPLAAAVLAGILLNSALSIRSGKGVSWKGRKYFQKQ